MPGCRGTPGLGRSGGSRADHEDSTCTPKDSQGKGCDWFQRWLNQVCTPVSNNDQWKPKVSLPWNSHSAQMPQDSAHLPNPVSLSTQQGHSRAPHDRAPKGTNHMLVLSSQLRKKTRCYESGCARSGSETAGS